MSENWEKPRVRVIREEVAPGCYVETIVGASSGEKNANREFARKLLGVEPSREEVEESEGKRQEIEDILDGESDERSNS